MKINDIPCRKCADAGVTKKGSWNTTTIYGVVACSICMETIDLRKMHARRRGENRWFRRAMRAGQTILRCKTDGKWVIDSWDDAERYAFALGKFAYRSPGCGEIHLASTPVRM